MQYFVRNSQQNYKIKTYRTSHGSTIMTLELRTYNINKKKILKNYNLHDIQL